MDGKFRYRGGRGRWHGKRAVGVGLALVLMAAGLVGCAGGSGSDGTQGGSGESGGASSDASQGALLGTDGSSDGKGRFLEQELFFPKNVTDVSAIAKQADGAILAVGQDEAATAYYVLRSDDQGENWESTLLEGVDLSSVVSAAISPDGEGVLLDNYGNYAALSPNGSAPNGGMDFSMPNNHDVTVVTGGGDTGSGTAGDGADGGADGGATRGGLTGYDVANGSLALPDCSDGNQNQVMCASYMQEGDLLVLDREGELYRANLADGTTEKLAVDIQEPIEYFTVAGNRILAVTSTGMRQIDSQSGKVIEDEALREATDGIDTRSAEVGTYPIVFAEGNEEDSVIYVSHEGLFYHQGGGSVSEQLIDGELVSLGDGSISFGSAITLGETTYLVLAKDSLGNSRLFRYGYDTDAPSVPQGELTVYALEDSQVLMQAVSLFQKENPNVFVKKEIGLSGQDSVTAEDALRTLSTDILAGDGPDVLILDGMPTDSYIEKGILADISPLVEELESDSSQGIFTNIADAYRRDGKIYGMPSHFFVSMLVGDKEALASCGSVPELADYATRLGEEHPDENILAPLTAEGLLNELYYMDSANWVSDDGIPSEEAIRGFLSAAQALYGLYGEGDISNPNVTNYTFQNGTLYGSLSFGEMYRMRRQALLSFGTAVNLDNMGQLYAWEAKAGGEYQVFGKEDASFVPYVSVGILAGQEENEAAREFVRVLLGKDCQTISRDGFPVNHAAFEAQQETQDEYMFGFGGENGELYSVDVGGLSDSQISRLADELSSIRRVAWTDRVVQELVVGEGKKCLQGEQGLDEAVDSIMQKVRLYEAE